MKSKLVMIVRLIISFTGNSKFSVNGENLPVITGKFCKINKQEQEQEKHSIFFKCGWQHIT
jgi:hypothetical protein